jgi:hypothetical protein
MAQGGAELDQVQIHD